MGFILSQSLAEEAGIGVSSRHATLPFRLFPSSMEGY